MSRNKMPMEMTNNDTLNLQKSPKVFEKKSKILHFFDEIIKNIINNNNLHRTLHSPHRLHREFYSGLLEKAQSFHEVLSFSECFVQIASEKHKFFRFSH